MRFDCLISGSTFSGTITEPANISEGPVNIKFTSNCISVICPIKETSLKTWLLHKVTSFGQCGGIFTFEVCSHCSEPSGSVSRCSINLIQEKPTIILNILERAIRSNPHTSEIHYERSILGDIYHCGHDCTHPGRLMPAYSDPNIFSSGGSFSPPRTPLASIEVHTTNNDQLESSDSGLPGTPQPEELSIASTGIPSPTSSYRSNPFRSPRHQLNHYPRNSSEYEQERQSVRHSAAETPTSIQRESIEMPSPPPYTTVKSFENSPSKPMLPNNGRVQYALIDHSAPVRLVRPPEYAQDNQKMTSSTPITIVGSMAADSSTTVNTTDSVPRDRKNNYNKLKTLEESTEAIDDVIYDVPNCEFLSDPFYPASAPVHGYMETSVANKSPNHHHSTPPPKEGLKSPSRHIPAAIHSPTNHEIARSLYTPGADRRDREEDYEEAWVSPFLGRKNKASEGQSQTPLPRKNHVLGHRDTGSRRRFQSSSDILDASNITSRAGHRRERIKSTSDHNSRSQSVAMNGNDRHLEKASNDFLKRLNEEEEKLSKVLAASRREKNEEIGDNEEARDRLGDLNRSYMFAMDDLDHDYSDPDTILETCSNLADYHSSNSHPNYLPSRLTKEPTNNIKGYAYKVTIPFTNTQYDVPRRAAAAPDLTTMSHDAPPKPKRQAASTEHLYFVNS